MTQLFLVFICLLSSLSCQKTSSIYTPTQQLPISLQIIPDYNGSSLVMYKTYSFNGKPIQFTRFSFILSKLCDDPTGDCSNRQTQFDFSSLTDSATSVNGLTNSVFINSTSSLIYRIGFGVDSVSNSITPAKQNQNSPLANGLNYWDAWNSYIFLKIEGMYDKDGDGVFETPFALHTGGNEIYTEKTFSLDKLSNATTVRLLFNVNLAKVINGIDLNVMTQTHKTGDLPVMKTMMNNFSAALIYKGSFVQ